MSASSSRSARIAVPTWAQILDWDHCWSADDEGIKVGTTDDDGIRTIRIDVSEATNSTADVPDRSWNAVTFVPDRGKTGGHDLYSDVDSAGWGAANSDDAWGSSVDANPTVHLWTPGEAVKSVDGSGTATENTFDDHFNGRRGFLSAGWSPKDAARGALVSPYNGGSFINLDYEMPYSMVTIGVFPDPGATIAGGFTSFYGPAFGLVAGVPMFADQGAASNGFAMGDSDASPLTSQNGNQKLMQEDNAVGLAYGEFAETALGGLTGTSIAGGSTVVRTATGVGVANARSFQLSVGAQNGAQTRVGILHCAGVIRRELTDADKTAIHNYAASCGVVFP